MPPRYPKTVDGWIDGGPWQKVDKEFWPEMRAGRFPESFTLHEEGRYSHELAHCIAADDKDLFEVCWGNKEFPTFFNKVSYETTVQEMKVIRIQAILDQYLDLPDRNEYRYPDQVQILCRNVCNREEDIVHWEEVYKSFDHVGSIAFCWKELQRKYMLAKERM